MLDTVAVSLLMGMALVLALQVPQRFASVRAREFMVGSRGHSLRNVAAQLFAQFFRVIPVNLRIVAPGRHRHISQSRVDELLVGLLGIHVHQNAIGGGSLAAVAGDGIAVVEMRMLADIELYVPSVVQSNLKIPLRVDLFDGPELAVGNPLVPVRRGELHAVAGWEFAPRFQVGTHAMQPAWIVSELLADAALHRM